MSRQVKLRKSDYQSANQSQYDPRNPTKEFSNTKAAPFLAKTKKQKDMFLALNSSTITFAKGPAGTGKSYVAIKFACEGLLSGRFDTVLLTRPMVPAAYEDVGALPGDIYDKFVMPYIGPVRPILDECLGKGHVDMYIKEGKITCLPLAFMRGSTYNNTCIILDEAQNCVPEQLKMILTRIGKDSKVIVSGDGKQSDIRTTNGLDDAVNRLTWHPDVSVIEFERSDIVRHSIIGDILQSYEDSL